MSTTTVHPLAADYLRRLRRAARALPHEDRRELLAEIESHLAQSIDADTSDVDVLGVLERLGTPEEIVRAQVADASSLEPQTGAREWLAIVLLLFGGFAVGLGWIVGLVLLWTSRIWSGREKWVGTLVIPFGLALPVWLLLIATRAGATAEICRGVAGGPPHCTPVAGAAGPGPDWIGIAVAGVLIIASVAGGLRLASGAKHQGARAA